MATTENGTYYPSDYSSIADVPEDMKKLAESVDANKVQKIQGKGLSTNDFTNELKRKLEGLNNYDDTDIKRDISVIKEEQQKQNENIENLQTDNEINKSDIASLKTEITELEEDVKANGITEETEEAKSLYIPNASGSRGKIIVMGNVEQETSETGVNKFSLGEDKQTQIGLEVTLDKSRVVVNGTSTSSGYLWNYNDNENKALKFIGKFKAGTYKWFHIYNSGNFSGEGAFAFYIRNESTSPLATLTNTDSSKTVRTITLEEDTNLYVNGFVNSANMVFNNLEILFQLQDDSIETTDYEEFIPNMPSPNYPSLVKCLGNNKQLFDEVFRQGNESSTSSTTLVFSSNNIPCNKGKNYTISTNIDLDIYKYAIFVNTNNFPTSNPNADNTGWKTEEPITINPTVNGYIGMLVSRKDNAVFSPEDISNYYFKVEEGIKATSYSPYGQGSTNVQIEIGDKTDYEKHKKQEIVLYLQKEMLTGDYFDLEKKKGIHTWEKYVIVGNENWSIFGTGTDNYFYQLTMKDKVNKVNEGMFPLSNYYKGASIATANTEKGVFVTINGTIRIREEKEETIEQFKAKLQKLYNAGNPIEIWYKLAETTELDLTEAQIQQLEQLSKLRFYKGINKIITTENIALLKAEYSVDIKSYIESLTTNEEG